MNIVINNGFIVICAFFFFLSYFFAYLFKKANIFFKIVLFIFIGTIFSLVEQANNIEITISSLLGVLVVYGESILDFAFVVRSWVEFIIDCIKSFFKAIFNFIKFVFFGVINFIAFPFKLTFKLVSWFFGWIFKFYKFFRDWEHEPRVKEQKQSQQQEKRQQQKSRDRQADMEEELRQAKEELKRARERAKKQESQEQANSNTDEKVYAGDTRTFEQILGLSQNFTRDDLKKAYQIATLRYHPDKYTHMTKSFQEEAQREFVKIQQAYNALSGRFK